MSERNVTVSVSRTTTRASATAADVVPVLENMVWAMQGLASLLPAGPGVAGMYLQQAQRLINEMRGTGMDAPPPSPPPPAEHESPEQSGRRPRA